MPKVICNLPNASGLISGVKFVSHRDGMISEEISKEQADQFCSIPGYVPAKPPGKGKDEEKTASQDPMQPQTGKPADVSPPVVPAVPPVNPTF